MHVATTIEANATRTEVVAPRVSPFNYPAEFAQIAAMFSSTLRDHWPDATTARALAMFIGVVAAISVNDFGFAKRSATRAPNREDGTTNGGDWVTPLRLAPVSLMLTGTPLAPTRTWCFERGRVRSVGFGPVFRLSRRLVSTKNQQWHMRDPVARIRAACRAPVHAVCFRCLPSAMRPADASRSRPSQTSVCLASGYIAARCVARTERH